MRTCTAIALLLIVAAAQGQSSLTKKQRYDSLMQARKNIEAAFIQLSPADKVADIGTGAGYSLVPIVSRYPQLRFVAEDIDSGYCNKKLLTKAARQLKYNINTDSIDIHIGTEKSTGLPPHSFTKVLAFDVLHEMTYKTEMLADIKNILQQNGVLIIGEILVHKTKKKERTCNYPYLTETELKDILSANHLRVTKEAMTFDNGRNKYLKLFECIFTE